MTAPIPLPADDMEALAFDHGLPIEVDGDRAHLTAYGVDYVAELTDVQQVRTERLAAL